MLRDALDPLTARRFRTGRPCLDFAHTGGVEGWLAAELIHDAADAGQWLALVLDLDAVHAAPADLEPIRTLREALWQMAQATMRGRAHAGDDIAVVNAAAAAAPPRPRMTLAGDGQTVTPVDVTQALSALARDAIELFTGPLAGRIRTCAAHDCELLFVDASRPGRRRWCSMQRCGSRAKMRRHRAGD
jgi:predicted RNA-binding Zn ribbon-like protein